MARFALITTVVERIGAFFVKKESGKISKTRVAFLFLASVNLGCVLHASDAGDYAACVDATANTYAGGLHELAD